MFIVFVAAATLCLAGCGEDAGTMRADGPRSAHAPPEHSSEEKPAVGESAQGVPPGVLLDTNAYYAAIDPVARGEGLKAQLHARVAGHRALDYGELWDALAYTDADPDRDGAVILFYTGWSRSVQMHGGRPSEWNREHVWAKSRGGFGSTPPMGTDLHYIRPTDVSVNHARANLAFDEGGSLYTDGDGQTRCRLDHDSWEPRDAVKGDVARMLFYAVVRYESPSMDFELVDTIHSAGDRRPVHGVLTTLLAWHAADPPSAFERRRNDRIYELQGNRNPFIDRPEWVDRIWASPDAG